MKVRSFVSCWSSAALGFLMPRYAGRIARLPLQGRLMQRTTRSAKRLECDGCHGFWRGKRTLVRLVAVASILESGSARRSPSMFRATRIVVGAGSRLLSAPCPRRAEGSSGRPSTPAVRVRLVLPRGGTAGAGRQRGRRQRTGRPGGHRLAVAVDAQLVVAPEVGARELHRAVPPIRGPVVPGGRRRGPRPAAVPCPRPSPARARRSGRASRRRRRSPLPTGPSRRCAASAA